MPREEDGSFAEALGSTFGAFVFVALFFAAVGGIAWFLLK